MASPPQGHGAAAAGAVVDSPCLDPEQQLTQALAAFQAQVEPIAGADLAAVVRAGRPAFARGFRWSAQLLQERGQSLLRVTLAHSAGAELCSEAMADELEDPVAASGRMLALLLGIPVSTQAWTAEPESSDAPAGGTEQGADGTSSDVGGDAAAGAPQPPCGPDPALAPLEPEQIQACHQRILALPDTARRQLTTAFREHFQVPRSARSIGDRITQQRHAAFIECFLEECDSSGAEPPVTAAEPAG